MVDVDRRIPPSFTAGLRRLSARASTATTSSSTPRSTAPFLNSFATLSSSLLSTTNHIPFTSPGLTEPELSRIESLFNFSFPPDLLSLLSLALPSPTAGFPDWRFLSSLSSLFHLPTTSFLLHLSAANSSVWPTSSWGSQPVDHEMALSEARRKLRRAPVLVPLFGRCYIPSKPCLAGNPVFYVDDTRIFCCALDLQDFFSRALAGYKGRSDLERLPTPIDRVPRWIEFWSEAASFDRRRRSRAKSVDWSGRSSSCSSVDSCPDPERYVEIRNPKDAPEWVERYMERVGAALREGGWGKEEVEEMVGVSGCCWMGGTGCDQEGEMVMDVMAMRAERWGEELRRAGWSSEEAADALGLGKESEAIKIRVVKLPLQIQMKVEKLAQEFNNY